MTETATDIPNLWQWFRLLNQHEADQRDIDLLREFMGTMGRLGSMIVQDPRNPATSMELFTVHDSYPDRSLTTPQMGYVGEGFELRLVRQPNYVWLVSVKITNGKAPAHPKLNKLIEAAQPPSLTVSPDRQLPVDWQFGEFSENSQEFTVCLSHDLWLFAFIYLLLDELSQH